MNKLTGSKNTITIYWKPLINTGKSSLVSQIWLVILYPIPQTCAGYQLNHSHSYNFKISDFRRHHSKLNSFQHNYLCHSFPSKTHIFLKCNLHIKSVNYQTSYNLLSYNQILQTSIQRRLSCLSKSTKIKRNLATQVTSSISSYNIL